MSSPLHASPGPPQPCWASHVLEGGGAECTAVTGEHLRRPSRRLSCADAATGQPRLSPPWPPSVAGRATRAAHAIAGRRRRAVHSAAVLWCLPATRRRGRRSWQAAAVRKGRGSRKVCRRTCRMCNVCVRLYMQCLCVCVCMCVCVCGWVRNACARTTEKRGQTVVQAARQPCRRCICTFRRRRCGRERGGGGWGRRLLLYMRGRTRQAAGRESRALRDHADTHSRTFTRTEAGFAPHAKDSSRGRVRGKVRSSAAGGGRLYGSRPCRARGGWGWRFAPLDSSTRFLTPAVPALCALHAGGGTASVRAPTRTPGQFTTARPPHSFVSGDPFSDLVLCVSE